MRSVDPMTAELRDLEIRWRVPSYMVGERGHVPEGIEAEDLARWRKLYAAHVTLAFEPSASPRSAPPVDYVRRSTRAKQPPAEPQAPLWRRAPSSRSELPDVRSDDDLRRR